MIIERPGQPRGLIEIKSTSDLNKLDKTFFNTFKSITQDIENSEAFIFLQDPIEQKMDHVKCMPWQKGLKVLGF